MPSGFYSKALEDILGGVFSLSSTLKVMLVDTAYVYDPDHTVIDNGANNTTDPSFCELVATNYAGGFNGAGRKTATITRDTDNATNRARFALGDLTWTALGGATNGTIGGAILIREVTNDAASRVVAFWDLTDTPTNGGDITLDFAALAAGGNLQAQA